MEGAPRTAFAPLYDHVLNPTPLSPKSRTFPKNAQYPALQQSIGKIDEAFEVSPPFHRMPCSHPSFDCVQVLCFVLS